jgi:hypothetical protein
MNDHGGWMPYGCHEVSSSLVVLVGGIGFEVCGTSSVSNRCFSSNARR